MSLTELEHKNLLQRLCFFNNERIQNQCSITGERDRYLTTSHVTSCKIITSEYVRKHLYDTNQSKVIKSSHLEKRCCATDHQALKQLQRYARKTKDLRVDWNIWYFTFYDLWDENGDKLCITCDFCWIFNV